MMKGGGGGEKRVGDGRYEGVNPQLMNVTYLADGPLLLLLPNSTHSPGNVFFFLIKEGKSSLSIYRSVKSNLLNLNHPTSDGASSFLLYFFLVFSHVFFKRTYTVVFLHLIHNSRQ